MKSKSATDGSRMTSFAAYAQRFGEHPNTRAANVVRLQLLTGAQLGEVLSSRKEDFDLQRGVWTKPSHRTKQRRTEHIPLSAQALVLIASIVETSGPDSPFLFPGNKPGQPLRET